MLRRLLVAAVLGLVPVAVALPAHAAEPAPLRAAPPSPAAQAMDCGQATRQAQRVALATGRSANATCISRASAPAGTSAVAPMEVAGCGINSWTLGRHSACKTENDWVLNVFSVSETGARVVVGQIFHTVTSGTETSGVSSRWHHRFTITFGYAWGAVSGTQVFAEPECLGNCRMVSGYFQFGPALAGTQRSGLGLMETSSFGQGSIWLAGSRWFWRFANPAWINPVTDTQYITPPAHRCDEAVGIAGSVGCVYPQKRPIHEIGMTRWPKYARHIQLALNFGLPSVLTRTQDQAQINANRAKACPQSPANGWSCDEYPFASTHEGAANPSHPYGRTFQILNVISGAPPFICGVNWLTPRTAGDSRGYSVCGIPLAENTGGGVDLGVFYVANRVLHNDQFQVKVV